MDRYALQVSTEENPATYRWKILEASGGSRSFNLHSTSECDFDSYANALNAGTLALARLDGEPYENEAADPVGDADCAAESDETAQPVTQQIVTR